MVEVNTIKSVYPRWRVTPAQDKSNSKKKDQQANADEDKKFNKNDPDGNKTNNGHSHIDDYV
jgi:hypothetical protein